MGKRRRIRHRAVTRVLLSAGWLVTTVLVVSSGAVQVLAQGSLIHFERMFESEDEKSKEIAGRVNLVVDKLEAMPPAERGALIPVLLDALPAPQKGKSFPWVVVSHSLDFGMPEVDPKRDMPVRSALIQALLGKNGSKAAAVLSYSVPADSVPYTEAEIGTIFQVPANAPVEIRVCVVRLLWRMPKAYHERAFRYMMKVMASEKNPSMRLYACAGLARLVDDDDRFDKELTPLFDAIVANSTEDPLVRNAAMSGRLTLQKRNPASSPLPALAKALASPDEHVQSSAIYSIGELRAAAGPLVPQLCHYLKDPGNTYPGRDGHILDALEKIGPAAACAVPTLIWYLKEYPAEHFDGQGRVCGVLGNIGLPAVPACPELIKLLQNGRPLNRLAAANTLGKFGPRAKAALPALRKACKDSRNDGLQYAVPQSQEACKKAIKKIEGNTK